MSHYPPDTAKGETVRFFGREWLELRGEKRV